MNFYHFRLEKPWSCDHLGIILESCCDGFRTKCLSLFDIVLICSGHVWDMFGHTFGTLSENCFGKIEISKSNETLPDHFSIKNEASHEVERQIRRFVFPFDISRKVLLNYVRQPYGLISCVINKMTSMYLSP